MRTERVPPVVAASLPQVREAALYCSAGDGARCIRMRLTCVPARSRDSGEAMSIPARFIGTDALGRWQRPSCSSECRSPSWPGSTARAGRTSALGGAAALALRGRRSCRAWSVRAARDPRLRSSPACTRRSTGFARHPHGRAHAWVIVRTPSCRWAVTAVVVIDAARIPRRRSTTSSTIALALASAGSAASERHARRAARRATGAGCVKPERARIGSCDDARCRIIRRDSNAGTADREGQHGRPHRVTRSRLARDDQTNRLTRFSSIFLAAGLRLRIDVRRHRRIGDRRQRRALRVDLLAQLALPLRVTLLDELVDAAVLDERGRRQQRARQQVEAADVAVEHVGRIDRLAAHLGVEVEAAGGEAAGLAGCDTSPASCRADRCGTGRCPSRSADRRG